MKIRIKFSKHGAIRYIGHLDVMRYFQKAMRRANIDIKYSGGMSPHQIMSFAQPLSVGSESDAEYMDIEVNSSDPSEVSIEKLNAVMADGIRVLEFKRLEDNEKNAMSSIVAADYEIRLRKDYQPDFDLQNAVDGMMRKKQVMIMKKTKKGEQEYDIRPFLHEIKALKTDLSKMTEEDSLSDTGLFMRLSAGSENNIKPRYVMEAVYTQAGKSLPEYALRITRKELYMEQDGQLVTLGSVGEKLC